MGTENAPGLPVPAPDKSTHALHPAMLGAILLAVLLGTGVLVRYILNEPQPANPEIATHQTAAQTAGDTQTRPYTVTQIPDAAIPFHITQYPKATFTLLSITRIDGLKAGSCSANQPKEVARLVKLGANCSNSSVFDPNISYSLIGIRLHVINNSDAIIQGDLFKLVYLPDPASMQFAQQDIDFTSYTIGYREDRIVDLSFWIPSTQATAYLAYAPQEKSTTNPPFNLGPLGYFKNAIKLDFNNSSAALGIKEQ